MQRPEMGLDVQTRSIRARPHTERKRAEKERERLRQAQADLAHISRVTTMGLWTPSLVHEIRQPIGAAINSANACLRWLARERTSKQRPKPPREWSTMRSARPK
jgi:C4-dicarboxylate-specific signal transduction histidine kinase